jgi:hypothetical protein
LTLREALNSDSGEKLLTVKTAAVELLILRGIEFLRSTAVWVSARDTIVTVIEDGQQAIYWGHAEHNATKRQSRVRVGRVR